MAIEIRKTDNIVQVIKDETLTYDSLKTFMQSGEIDYIDFNTNASVSSAEGRIFWNDDDKTLNIGTEQSDVTIQVGQEEVLRVVNKTGSTLTNGQVVYVSGSQGNRPTAALADADLSSSHATIGVVAHNISNNNNGYITTYGLVRDINTSSFDEGDTLYVSQTAGALTNVAPAAPAHRTEVGICLNSHATEGVILVNVRHGVDLTDLDDVVITDASNGEVLTYEDGLWVNSASSGGGGSIVYYRAFNQSVSNTNTEANLVSFTVAGGDMETNKILQLDIEGYVRNQSGSTANFVLAVKFGSTTIFSDKSQNFASDISDDYQFTMSLMLANANSASSQVMGGSMRVNSGSDDGTGRGQIGTDEILISGLMGHKTAVTEDTSTDKTFAITVNPSVAHADYSINATIVKAELK